MISKWSGPVKAFLISVIAFFILYFGFSKVSPDIRNPEKSAVLNPIDKDFNQLALQYLDSLSSEDRSQAALYYQQLEKAVNDSIRSFILQKISGFWYQQGKVGLAADYAREVAKKMNSPESWSIAATNFVLALKTSINPSETEKANWLSKAREGFNQAAMIDTGNVTYKVNKALLSVEFPENGPMEGILALRALATSYPDNALVLYHLARLAIETNQIDRAKERLDHLLKTNPGFSRAYCLMAKIAEIEHNENDLKRYQKKCKDE